MLTAELSEALLRQRQGELARAHEGLGRVDNERLTRYWRDAGEVTRAVEALVGRVRQQPPRYSAVKHRGKPL
jgi:hypothetical protein